MGICYTFDIKCPTFSCGRVTKRREKSPPYATEGQVPLETLPFTRRGVVCLHPRLHRRIRTGTADHTTFAAGYFFVRKIVAALPCLDYLNASLSHLCSRVQRGWRHPRIHQSAHSHRVVRGYGGERTSRAESSRLDSSRLCGDFSHLPHVRTHPHRLAHFCDCGSSDGKSRVTPRSVLVVFSS